MPAPLAEEPTCASYKLRRLLNSRPAAVSWHQVLDAEASATALQSPESLRVKALRLTVVTG